MMIYQRSWKYAAMALLVLGGFPLVFAGVAGFDSSMGGTLMGGGETPVVQVGKSQVGASQFLNVVNGEIDRRSRAGQPTEIDMLVKEGVIDQILQSLADQVLLTEAARQKDRTPGREYLKEALKESFTDEAGNFQAAQYNAFVQRGRQSGYDWDVIYDNISRQTSGGIQSTLAVSSARVPEGVVRKRFETTNTKLLVKYAAIEPKIELTEEDIQAQYDENTERYMSPKARDIEFVAVSLEPPDPPELQEAIRRAREGEDFAALAQEYSVGPTAEQGGDLGWIAENDSVPSYQTVIFTLPVGAVSEPVRALAGIHVYKVDEERTNDDGVREVRVSEIVFRPNLTEEERTAIAERATDLQQRIAAADDVSKVAEEEDMIVYSAVEVSRETENIPGVFETDTFAFRQELEALEAGAVSEVIQGNRGVYIVKVTSMREPQQLSLEDAREDVERDAIATKKNTPEYVNRVGNYIDTIRTQAESLEDIATLYPDLELDIQEAGPFGPNDFMFNEGIFWNTQQAATLLEGKEPGAVVGPIMDFQRSTFFLELVERIPPSEEDWAVRWPEERESLLMQERFARINRQQQDYTRYLRERMGDRITIDIDAAYRLLGLGGADDVNRMLRESAQSAPEPEAVSAPVEPVNLDDLTLELDEISEPLEEDAAETETP